MGIIKINKDIDEFETLRRFGYLQLSKNLQSEPVFRNDKNGQNDKTNVVSAVSTVSEDRSVSYISKDQYSNLVGSK